MTVSTIAAYIGGGTACIVAIWRWLLRRYRVRRPPPKKQDEPKP